MRLLRVEDLRFEDVPSHGSCPEYAILSHTWIHPSGNEVSLQDILHIQELQEDVHQKAGWPKLKYLVDQAKRSNLRYVWMDTCCIDQRNPTELTEAINCMFAWYSRAAVCYVYLSDVDLVMERDSHFQYSAETLSMLAEALSKCKWIQRGWTLQELIAPTRMMFFSKNWSFLMGSADSPGLLAQVTGIDVDMLAHKRPLYSYSIAQRLPWASNRMTTFPEDRAYSLVGLFGITMATHYGEGEHRAFVRLQEEIVKISTDQSLFAWHGKDDSLLAPSLNCFKDRGHVVPRRGQSPVPYHIDNIGLQIELCAGRTFAILDCRSLYDVSEVFVLRLRPGPGGHSMLDPVRRCEAIDWRALCQRERQAKFPRKLFSIRKFAASYGWSDTGRICDSKGPWHLKLRMQNADEDKEGILRLAGVRPSADWVQTSVNSFYYKPSSIWKADGPYQGAIVCIKWPKYEKKPNDESASWQYGAIASAYGRRGSYAREASTPLPVLDVKAISETRNLEEIRSYVHIQAKDRLSKRSLGSFESLPLKRSMWCRGQSTRQGLFLRLLGLPIWQQVRVTLDKAEIAGETFWELDVAEPQDRSVLSFVAAKVHSYLWGIILSLQKVPGYFQLMTSYLEFLLHISWPWLLLFNEWFPLLTVAVEAQKLDDIPALWLFAAAVVYHYRDDWLMIVSVQFLLTRLGSFLLRKRLHKRIWLWLSGSVAQIREYHQNLTLSWSQSWRWLEPRVWWTMASMYQPGYGFTRAGNTFLVANLALLVYLNRDGIRQVWLRVGQMVVRRNFRW